MLRGRSLLADPSAVSQIISAPAVAGVTLRRLTRAKSSCLASFDYTRADALDQHLEDAVAGGKPDERDWKQSSRCQGGACVEVASLGEQIAMRDSGDPGRILTFSATNWRDFIADVKADKLGRAS